MEHLDHASDIDEDRSPELTYCRSLLIFAPAGLVPNLAWTFTRPSCPSFPFYWGAE